MCLREVFVAVPYRKSRVEGPPADCPLLECMGLIGGVWTVQVIWYLREGRRRFGELKGDLRGISSKVLSVRLRELESNGLVMREEMATSPPTVEYELTYYGRRLLGAIDEISEVGLELKRERLVGGDVAGGG